MDDTLIPTLARRTTELAEAGSQTDHVGGPSGYM